MNKYIFFIIFVLSIFSVSAGIIEDKIEQTSLNNISFSIVSGNYDDLNINLFRGETIIKLHNVTNFLDIDLIYINDNFLYDTSAVTISNIEFSYAELILKKNHNQIVTKIIHSENGINFSTVYNIPMSQNSTHIMFNVTHFSSWTGEMDDIYIFNDFIDPVFPELKRIVDGIDLTEFATIDGTDCINYRWEDTYHESNNATSTCAGDKIDVVVQTDYFACFGDEIYRFDLSDTELIIYPSDLCDAIQDDTFPGARFQIYDITGTILRDESGQINIKTKDFNFPDVNTYSASAVGETTATLRGIVSYDDLNNRESYDFNAVGFEKSIFLYRVKGDSEWLNTTTWVTTDDNTLITKEITDLLPGTTYEYQMEFTFYDMTLEADSGYVYGDIEEFTTTAEGEPSVVTYEAVLGDSKAKLRAFVDYNDYSGGDLGIVFYYNTSGASSYIRIPFAGFEVPVDAEIFSTSFIINLTNGQEYEFYPMLVWDSGTKNSSGEVKYFTPLNESGGLESGSAYWNFDDLTDEWNGLTLTNNGAVQSVSYPTFNDSGDSADYSLDFEEDDEDYLSIADNSLLDFGTGDFSVCFWMKMEVDDAIVSTPISKRQVGEDHHGYYFEYVSVTDTIRFLIDSPSDTCFVTSRTIPNSDLWTHYCGVADRNDIDNFVIYVNGVNDSNTISGDYEGDCSASISNNGAFYVGRAPPDVTDRFHDGLIDEVMMFDYALEPEDVSFLYNSGFIGSSPVIPDTILSTDLDLYYELEETTTPYVDSTLNNDLTIASDPDRVAGIINFGQDIDRTNNERIYDVATTDWNLEKNFSVSFWHKMSSTSTNHQFLIGNYYTPDGATEYGFDCFVIESDAGANANKLQCNFNNPAFATDSYITSTAFSTGTWYHVVIKWDGDINISINAVQDGAETAEGTSVIGYDGNNHFLQIGDLWYNGVWLNYDYSGIIDEIGYWSRILTPTEITTLYNGGSGLSYDDILLEGTGGGASGIDLTTLNPNNITYSEANLRALPELHIPDEPELLGNFRWRINGTSTWDNISSGGLEVANNTIFSFLVENLTSDSIYEYESFIFNGSLTTQIWYSNNTKYFTTFQMPNPSITTLSAQNVSNESAVFRGSIDNLFGWSDVNYYFSYRKTGDNFTNTGYTNVNSTGTYTFEITNLSEESDYIYLMLVDFTDAYNETEDGNYVLFSTSETGAPIINTLDATVIRRTSANLNGEIVDLGYHSNITLYFNYWNSTHNFSIGGENFEALISYQENVSNLISNTTYTFEMLANYSLNSQVSGGKVNLTTFDESYYLAPDIQVQSIDEETDVTSYSAFLQYRITLYQDETVIVNNYIYEGFEDFLLIENLTVQTVNASGIYDFLPVNLETNTEYAYRPVVVFYNGSENLSKSAVPNTFTTLDSISDPKSVYIFPGFEIWVQDPYFFMLILLISTTVFGLGLSVGAKYIGSTGADKFLVYLVLALFIIEVIWGYIQIIVPFWELLLILFGSILLGFYYFMENSRGVVYG